MQDRGRVKRTTRRKHGLLPCAIKRDRKGKRRDQKWKLVHITITVYLADPYNVSVKSDRTVRVNSLCTISEPHPLFNFTDWLSDAQHRQHTLTTTKFLCSIDTEQSVRKKKSPTEMCASLTSGTSKAVRLCKCVQKILEILEERLLAHGLA